MKRLLIVILLLCSPAWAVRNDDSITVKVHAPTVTERTFDRNHMPSDMPPLRGNEAAVTVSEFAASSDVQATVLSNEPGENGFDATVRVNGITIEPNLTITIWLPNDTNQKLRDHEYGHRTISEHFYETIKPVAEQLARKIIGKRYKATGRSADEASKNAIRKAIAEVNDPLLKRIDGVSSKAQDKYDELTDHGRNKVSENHAIIQSIREVDR